MPPSFSIVVASILFLSLIGPTRAQTSTGSIFGIVYDQNQAVIAGASVTIRNTATGFTRSASTDLEGRYSFLDLPIGPYELTVEAATFSKYLRTSFQLLVNENAPVSPSRRPGELSEVVEVDSDAPPLNTTTPEVATRFDSRRLSELPIAPNRNVYNALSSAPGVSQLATGQPAFALATSIAVNGGRIRSNNFLLDGQDMNDPAVTGSQMPLNNPDAIQEVRIVTNQFLPEYGHNSGSVVNIVGKSGTNHLQGSVFWFHNNEHLNACSNTDKRAGFCHASSPDRSKTGAPYRRENQYGFTLGGPLFLPRLGEDVPPFYNGRDRTFFFADYQRWSDRRTPSLTLRGAPSAAGRDELQNFVGDRPQVQALLQFVPAGIPNGGSRTVNLANGQTFDVELGDLTGSSDFKFDSDQGSFRIDHLLNKNNTVYGRYRSSYDSTSGAGQITPSGHSEAADRKASAASIVWTSMISPTVSNEARIAWKRYYVNRVGADPLSATIPPIQINDLGMTGGLGNDRRTAFGLSFELPIIRTNNTYQITDSISVFKGNHSFKFGTGLARNEEKARLFSLDRGNLIYATLNDFVNDIALVATQGLPVPGSDLTQFYRWHEFYVYAQDQWRILPTLTLSYGVRYEYPGDSFQYLRDLNRRILAANNNDPEFRFLPDPQTDTNNWMPRVGFSWNPKTKEKGVIGLLTGGNKLVIRGGYARTYDANPTNTNNNVFFTFPFTAAQPTSLTNAYTTLVNMTVPDLSDPRQLSRTVVPEDFRSPATDQFSFDIQRELSADLLFRIGYVRTRGTGLFQVVDGNPREACLFGTGPGLCNTTGIDRNTGAPLPPGTRIVAPRVDPTREVIEFRTNSASSTYDSLQASLEKRLSRGLSFGLHYTWSAFLDTASDTMAPSVAEVSVAQDPFDRNADWARSAYDRPHRLSGNVVYELPFFQKQRGFVGKLLGGWQINSFFNFQTGAPFTPLNGSDPAGVGSIGMRPNLYTSHDLSGMSLAEVYRLNQQLTAAAALRAREIFTTFPQPPITCSSPRWLSGPPLPFTLFSAPRGRIVCNRQGQLEVVLVHNGIIEGQRVGNAGRNILRADGVKLVDIGIIKNTKLAENVRAQFWVDAFNAFNFRNFGIPSGIITSTSFLDQWATDGGSRRIRFGARLVF